MNKPADEIVLGGIALDKHNYLYHEPTKVHQKIANVMHPNNDTCVIVNYKI